MLSWRTHECRKVGAYLRDLFATVAVAPLGAFAPVPDCCEAALVIGVGFATAGAVELLGCDPLRGGSEWRIAERTARFLHKGQYYASVRVAQAPKWPVLRTPEAFPAPSTRTAVSAPEAFSQSVDFGQQLYRVLRSTVAQDLGS